MAQFLAQQQQQKKDSLSTSAATGRDDTKNTAAVVAAAEQDDHVRESVLKNDGSFMATFLALQHKEEQLAAKQQPQPQPSLSASSTTPAPHKQKQQSPPTVKRAVASDAAAPAASTEPPRKKRSRWDAGPTASDANAAPTPSAARSLDTATAPSAQSLSGDPDETDRRIRAKQHKHAEELRFLEQRIRGFQQRAQFASSAADRSEETRAMLADERRAEYERLAALLEQERTYRDSVEDAELGRVQDGTLEHRRRAREMLETLQRADAVTRDGEGKHHLGDFLPQVELDRLLAEANARSTGSASLADRPSQAAHDAAAAEQAPSRSSGGGDDDEFDQYRKRMMLAYRFRPNPLNNPRRPYT